MVHAVSDLDVAAAAYADLGFTVTPRADHPWGTANRLVLVEGSYVELLAVVQPGKLPEPMEGRFSFGHFNRRFFERGPGVSMLVLATNDAAATNRRFTAAGIGGYEQLDFSRMARQPDGSTSQVSFSLAFADSPFPHLGVFACQQRTPHLVWRREYIDHANGAARLAEVAVVQDADAGDVREFIAAATRATAEAHNSVATPAGAGTTLTFTTPTDFAYRAGAPTQVPSRLPAIGGLRFDAPPGVEPVTAVIEGAVVAVEPRPHHPSDEGSDSVVST